MIQRCWVVKRIQVNVISITEQKLCDERAAEQKEILEE